jgi:hypothetical protein
MVPWNSDDWLISVNLNSVIKKITSKQTQINRDILNRIVPSKLGYVLKSAKCNLRCDRICIGILVPRRDQSRADGVVGTGESLRCPIASPYLNTLLIFILSDTWFFTPSPRSLWCVPFLFFGSFSTLRKFRRNCLCFFAAKFDSKILWLPLS